MTKFSKFAYIAGTASAVTAGSWMMAFWGRNHGGHAYVQDYAYLATARAERRALCGLVGPTNEAFTMPLDFTNGNMAASVSNAWTNLVVHLPVRRAAYLTKDNILDDDALARSGAWVVPGVWPEDGSALEVPYEVYSGPFWSYSLVGAITNFPATDSSYSPYVHSWVPKAATNIYPRMQWLMDPSAHYYCPDGSSWHRWFGQSLVTNNWKHTNTLVEVQSRVVRAWSAASTNVVGSTNSISKTIGMGIRWQQSYGDTSPGNIFMASADLQIDWPLGPFGVAFDMAPRFWTSESGHCVVSNAWLVMEASVWAGGFGYEPMVSSDHYVAGDWDKWLASVEETCLEAFDAPGLTLRYGGFEGIAETNYCKAFLVPLSRTAPGDPLYPLWTYTPPPVPANLVRAEADAIFGAYPQDSDLTSAYPYFSAACGPVAVLLQGDFETYHASTNTWSDCGYYEP